MKKDINACGYVRVSTKEQEKGVSIEVQENEILKYCKDREWTITKIYKDTVTGVSEIRPGLNQLRRDAENRQFQVVVFHNADRLFREQFSQEGFRRWLLERDIQIASVLEPYVYEMDDNGKLNFTLRGMLAEHERVNIARRTKEGKWHNVKNGTMFPGIPPYGYKWNKKRKKIEKDSKCAPIYEQIYRWYLYEGLSTLRIANRLNRENVPSPGKRKLRDPSKISGRWLDTTVGRILKNDAYKGEKTYYEHGYKLAYSEKGSPYITADKTKPHESGSPITITFPRLIEPEQWDQIQEKLKLNKKQPRKLHSKFAKDRFLVKAALGRKFTCALCGSAMQARVIRRSKTAPIRLRYVCNSTTGGKDRKENSGNLGCKMKYDINSDKIDEYVWNSMINFLSDPHGFANEWIQKPDLDGIIDRIKELEKEKKQLEQKLRKIIELTVNRRLKPRVLEEYEKQHNEIAERLETVDLQIETENKKIVKQTNADNYLNDLKQEIEAASKRKDEARKIREKNPNNPRRAIITVKSISDHLANIPFDKKRSIIQAVVCPERGGTIQIGLRKISELFQEGLPPGVVDKLVPQVRINAETDTVRVSELIKEIIGKPENKIFNLHRSRRMP